MKTLERIALTALLGALLGGCQSNSAQTPAADDQPTMVSAVDFAPDDSARAYQAAANRQAALGDREDAMLNASHFDAASLNGLGRAKLDNMLSVPSRPLVVYLDLAADDSMTTARREAVAQYIKSKDSADNAFRIENGINPAMCAGAAPNLARVKKTESPEPSNNGTGGGTSTGSSSDNGSGYGSPSMPLFGTGK
jgi:hypothetical protein